MSKHIKIELVTGRKFEWEEKFLKKSVDELFIDIQNVMENKEGNSSFVRIETQTELKIFNLSHIMIVSLY